MKKYIVLCCSIILCAMPLFAQDFTIIQTTDLHSHFLGFSPNIDYTPNTINDDATIGGFARIATVINNIKKSRKNPVLLLDSGDFLMGSVFHLLCREEAFELRLMKKMGYDVITLGNHEFDLYPDGLARIIRAAQKYNALPAIVASNIVFSADSKDDDSLEKVFEDELVKPYTVMTKGKLKIGFFGLIGKDAAEVSPFAHPVTFADQVQTAKQMVDILRNKEKVDVVICISHSGIRKYQDKDEIEAGRSEDVQLAKEVKGIDVIISGHTHVKIKQPIIVGKTIITQSYEYGKQVAVLDLSLSKDGVVLKNYTYVDINDSIKGDPAITALINQFVQRINQQVLSPLKLTCDSVLAKTKFDLVIKEEETNLGNLIADSIRWYVNSVDFDPKDPDSRVAIGVISNGVIRDNIVVGKTGKVVLSDAFATIPLGIGMDEKKTMGYPLITCYVYASEIKKALEILTSIYPLKGNDYFIQVSGVKFTYNPKRMLFDRVTEIWIGDEQNGYVPLDYSDNNKKLYRIAADIYNATFLKIIGNFTWHILDIVPKWRDGKPIEKLTEARVDADKRKPGIQEAKEWIGVIEYIRSFKDEDGDGTPDIPAMYQGKLGRIVVEASLNPYHLLKRGTKVTWIGFIIFLIVVAIVTVVVVVVIKRFKR
ncbi:MAG: bifunctional UDP-sugar hydrolase/5'-nucleotidase [Spirochaetota bacterium]|nr:bifunctional UDP-sugar hydrolase/5'-nucleotidase [Spirochaetota bacterium]